MPKGKKAEAEPDVLKGWQQIAAFLGQPVAVAQRRATEGMPLQKAKSLSPVISRGIEPLVSPSMKSSALSSEKFAHVSSWIREDCQGRPQGRSS